MELIKKSSLKFYMSFISVMLTGLGITTYGSNSQSKEVQPGFTVQKESTGANWALRFDGTDDVVNCGDMDKLNNVSALTIEMWVNIEKFNPWRTFFAKRMNDYNRIQFQEYCDPGDIGIAVSSGTILGYYHTVNKPITIGDWFHLAMVFDGTRKQDSERLKVYINGREAMITPYKGEAVTVATPVNNAPVLLGAEKADGAYGYAGTMDEVRIWTVAKTDSQVIEDMRTTFVKDTSGLVAFYNFDEGAEKKLVDSIGKQDGTLKNFAVSGSNSNWISRGYVKPSAAARDVTPLAISAKKVQIGWKCGSGAYRAVFVTKGVDSLSVPNDLSTYKPGPFGSGSQIGSSGWYCVYNGSGCSTEISGLTVATEYVVHIVEYNGVSGKEHYLSVVSQGNPMKINTAPVADKPLVQSANLSVDSVNISYVNLSWSKGDGDGRMLLVTSDTIVPFPVLKEKKNYKAAQNFGSGDSIGAWQCVYNGLGDKTVITGLNPATRYRAIILEKNGVDVYTAWLNDTTAKNNTSFSTRTPPAVPNLVVETPKVVMPVTAQLPPQKTAQLKKNGKPIFIWVSGLGGLLATGIVSMIIVANNHSSNSGSSSSSSHDLGVPPIDP